MKLKTYMCPSMEVALKNIRSELGPDAVIISTLNEGDMIRVTAACENIHDHIIVQKTEPRVYSESETKNTLCHMLSYHQVPAETGDSLISKSCQMDTKILKKGIGSLFEKLFSFQSLTYKTSDLVPQQIMLAGPVGVGKTVTLAKIASEYKLLNKPVEIISADYLKAGAAEQIQLYANALEVPLTFVQTPSELEAKLEKSLPGVIYLIDTPGTNSLNEIEVSLLTDFILAAKQAPYLVLSAGTDPFEMRDLASAFKDLGCTRLIMTRFDAAKRFGGLLTVLHEECLEFSAMSCGPEIGNRLKSATPENLVTALNKYLPDTICPSSSQKPQQTLSPNPNTIKTPINKPISNTLKPEPELPAWIKGVMEARKA